MIVARGLGRPSNSIAAFGLALRAPAAVPFTLVHGGGDAPRRHEDEDDEEFDYKHLVLPQLPREPFTHAPRNDLKPQPHNPQTTVSPHRNAAPVLGADSTPLSQAALRATDDEEDELMRVFLIAMEATDF